MRKFPKVYLWMGVIMILVMSCSFLSSSGGENPSETAPSTAQSSPSEAAAQDHPEGTSAADGEGQPTTPSESGSANQAINWKKPVYADNFVDIYSGWPNDPAGTLGYPEAFEGCADPTGDARYPCKANPKTQVYQMNIDGNIDPPIYVSTLDRYEYGPVGMEIDTKVLENSLGHAFYGFVCHYRDTGNYNAIIVSTKGHIGIFKLVDGKTDYLFPSDLNTDFLAYMLAAQGDNVPITLRAECNGDALILSVADSVLAETKGGRSEAGLNGLIAGVEKEGDQGKFSINFDNYKVYTP